MKDCIDSFKNKITDLFRCRKSKSNPKNKISNTINLYDYDLFVIGGGSGGLSAAKQASGQGKKVGLADYIKPTPLGSKWGLGGTCVNVGCIPKKMMHFSGIMYESLEEFEKIGYPEKIPKKHDWKYMKNNIQKFILNLNRKYEKSLKEKKVTYYNKLAKLIDKNTIELTDEHGYPESVTADKILIAVGGRPNYLDIEGARELTITSDDIFSLDKPPGKTLIVGASYIALECGGFLNELGYETSIMVRSIILRGFDQEIAFRIEKNMSKQGIRFIKESYPTKFTKTDSGKVQVEYKLGNSILKTEIFDTVFLAIGRSADTKNLGLENVGIHIAKNGKIIVGEDEKSNIDNIFSIGDCAEGRPELTPPAIMAGKLLVNRLFGDNNRVNMDYKNIATTIFTPLEYGCIGYAEDDAKQKFK